MKAAEIKCVQNPSGTDALSKRVSLLRLSGGARKIRVPQAEPWSQGIRVLFSLPGTALRDTTPPMPPAYLCMSNKTEVIGPRLLYGRPRQADLK